MAGNITYYNILFPFRAYGHAISCFSPSEVVIFACPIRSPDPLSLLGTIKTVPLGEKFTPFTVPLPE
jgi:hypothetical protein